MLGSRRRSTLSITYFYHYLLREQLGKKAAAISDFDEVGREWLQIQKLRSKLKKVDSMGLLRDGTSISRWFNFMFVLSQPVQMSNCLEHSHNDRGGLVPATGGGQGYDVGGVDRQARRW